MTQNKPEVIPLNTTRAQAVIDNLAAQLSARTNLEGIGVYVTNCYTVHVEFTFEDAEPLTLVITTHPHDPRLWERQGGLVIE